MEMATTGKGGKFRFAIDRGGTFTDVFARCPDDSVRVMKLLSVDPKNYRDAPVSAGDIVVFRNNINPLEFFPPNRLKAFGVSWKMKLDGPILEMSALTPLILNGSGWGQPLQPMRCWKGKENVLDF